MTNNFDLFNLFEGNEEIKKFEEEQKKLVETKKEETKKEETKANVKTSSDNKEKKDSSNKKDSKPKLSNEEKIIADLVKAKKVICKVFGEQAFVLEDETQIKSLNKQAIIELLFDNGFEEFTAFNPELKCAVKEDGTAILLPLYPEMKSKG